MPNSLTQPTGAQIVAFFPSPGGALSVIGSLGEDTIDALVTNWPLSNPILIATTRIRELFEDPDDLTDLEFLDANPALYWACIWELLKYDRSSQALIPNQQGGNLNYQGYETQMAHCLENVSRHLMALNIRESAYHYSPASQIARVGGKCTYYNG